MFVFVFNTVRRVRRDQIKANGAGTAVGVPLKAVKSWNCRTVSPTRDSRRSRGKRGGVLRCRLNYETRHGARPSLDNTAKPLSGRAYYLQDAPCAMLLKHKLPTVFNVLRSSGSCFCYRHGRGKNVHGGADVNRLFGYGRWF